MTEDRRRGGQPGNQNARTHGFYSKVLNAAERLSYQNARTLPDQEALDDEIALLRTKTQTLVKTAPTRYDLLVVGLRTLTTMVSTRHRLSPKAKEELSDAVAAVIESVGGQLGAFDATT